MVEKYVDAKFGVKLHVALARAVVVAARQEVVAGEEVVLEMINVMNVEKVDILQEIVENEGKYFLYSACQFGYAFLLLLRNTYLDINI